MPTPKNITDLFSPTEPGKRLVDPEGMQQLLTLTIGYQMVTAQALVTPGPLMSQATNTVVGTGAAGTNFNVQLPMALGGRRVTIVNATPGTVSPNPQPYNPATGVADTITSASGIPTGSTYLYLCYQVGRWVVLSGGATGAEDPIEPEC